MDEKMNICPKCHKETLPKFLSENVTAVMCQNKNCNAVIDREGKTLQYARP